MQITRQTEYAVRVLMELAGLPYGQLISSRLLAERQNIPEEFLHKTVQVLARNGLVITQRGKQGGVRLGRPADEVTLADVIVAVEGPLALNVCLSSSYNCPNQPHCRVRNVIARAQRAMVAELSRETIADLIQK